MFMTDLPQTRSGVLIVEDKWLIATEAAAAIRAAGIQVIGPVSTVAAALALIKASGADEIGAAVLDVELDGEPVTPVTEALIARGVPFVYATGYGRGDGPVVPEQTPWLVKPIDLRLLVQVLTTVVPVGAVGAAPRFAARSRQ